MNRRVYDTAVRNLVQLSDEDFERAVEEARAKRAAPPEEPPTPEPKPERPKRSPHEVTLKALLRVPEPEFEPLISKARELRRSIQTEYETHGGKGDAFTAGVSTAAGLIADAAADRGEGYAFALSGLLNLDDEEFDMVINEARARRFTNAEWSTLEAGVSHENQSGSETDADAARAR
jgi:hypothetical protein